MSSNVRIAIMQPTFLPWIGYFDLIDRVDAFVYLDSVKYSRQSWQQRNQVKTAHGLRWITLPVIASEREGTTIAEALLGNNAVLHKNLKTVEQAYRKAPHFAALFPSLETMLSRIGHGSNLADLNVGLIEWACRIMNIETPRVRASTIKTAADRGGRLIDLCRARSANVYVSPAGAVAYMREAMPEFDRANINVVFHAYSHPEYSQLYPPFQPYAGVVDLLMNFGAEGLAVIRSGRQPDRSLAQVLADSPLANERLS